MTLLSPIPTSGLLAQLSNDISTVDTDEKPLSRAEYIERIKNSVRNLPAITEEQLAETVNCLRCEDSDNAIDKIHFRLTGEVVRCPCAIEKDRARRFHRAVELTPRKFRETHGIVDGLNSMRPMPEVHPNQPKELEKLRRNATKSFYIYGKTGSHKTTLAWALMQEAGRRGQPVGGNTGKSLIDTLRSYQFDKKLPRNGETFYELSQLENNKTRFCLLIDDIDGLVITEYTFGLLWDLLDKVQAYDQQLIITANKSIDKLLSEWATRDRDGRANAVNFCEKIARRLKEITADVDLS